MTELRARQSSSDAVQLRTDLLEGTVQVERRRADLVAAHAIREVGLDVLIGGGVEEHARNLGALPCALEGRLLVLHVGENLVQVP